MIFFYFLLGKPKPSPSPLKLIVEWIDVDVNPMGD
jgi:hypothetical protein